MKKIAIILSFMLMFSVFSVNAGIENENDIMYLLSELEIMTGDPDGNYRLSDNVTRGECTKMTVMASGYKNFVALGVKTSPFYDVPASHWAAPYIQVGVANGLCTGYLDASFQPEKVVKLEEAVTIFLKILGYTDEDFGTSWPYGQMGIANNLNITKNISKKIGEPLNRRDMMNLTYNVLMTPKKGMTADYITTLDYNVSDDVILISSPYDDSSVGSGKIFTSQGTYKVDERFNYENIGKKGSLILKKDEVVGFVPDSQLYDTYSIYELKSVDIDDSLTVYNKSQKTTFGAVEKTLDIGDTLTVYKNENGVLDYGKIKAGALKGPYTYTDISMLGLNNPTVTRNGRLADISALQINDIVYISNELNSVWAYSKTVTGIYEKAIPNKENPTSVVISGVTYNIEGADAFSKLSSQGNIAYGEHITVLLGKNNDIADVLTNSAKEVVGYFTSYGQKSYTRDDNSTYIKNYVTLVLPDGSVCEYTTDDTYEEFLNSVVRIKFDGGIGKLSVVKGETSKEGKISYTKNSMGTYKISSDVNILDIETTAPYEGANYANVFLKRLDGVTLKASDILYINTNEKGEISDLILNNVTGDLYSYGIVTDTKKVSMGLTSSGTYTLFFDGNVKTYQSDALYNVETGSPMKVSFSKTGIQSMASLKNIGSVKEITYDTVKTQSGSYPLWDKAVVYKKANTYTTVPLKDIIGKKECKLTAYTDGNTVRVIVLN